MTVSQELIDAFEFAQLNRSRAPGFSLSRWVDLEDEVASAASSMLFGRLLSSADLHGSLELMEHPAFEAIATLVAKQPWDQLFFKSQCGTKIYIAPGITQPDIEQLVEITKRHSAAL